MPPRIPTQADFAPLSSTLPVSIHFPNPPESTTAFLILFHGLGDHEVPFANFARNLSLPGVTAISVRGTAPLPLSLLEDEVSAFPARAAAAAGDNKGPAHFHWGDDLRLDTATGDVDSDPGFDKAAKLVMNELVRGVLIDKCGWEMRDILFFGFGQGGSLALGIASRLRTLNRIVDVDVGVSEGDATNDKIGKVAKGVVSIGGPLPASMIPSLSSRQKSDTPILVCQLDGDEQADAVRREFRDVRVVNWKRKGVAMPRDREEVFPIMNFFADQLNKPW